MLPPHILIPHPTRRTCKGDIDGTNEGRELSSDSKSNNDAASLTDSAVCLGEPRVLSLLLLRVPTRTRSFEQPITFAPVLRSLRDGVWLMADKSGRLG